MSLERLTALAAASYFSALHPNRNWLAASDSAPPIPMPSATFFADGEGESIDVDRFDPNGSEMLIAAANRKAARSPQRLRVSAAGRGS